MGPVRVLAAPCLVDHLSPHGVALPRDVLALVLPELLEGLHAVSIRHTAAVEVDEHSDPGFHLVLGYLLEWYCLLDDIVQVAVLEVAVCDLVISAKLVRRARCSIQNRHVLLQNLAETRVIQLDVGPEGCREDIEVRDLALVQQLRIPCIVVACRPDCLGLVARRRNDAVLKLACNRARPD